ncbi:MAG TPA: carboxymuconolactone decarboxylase family protein [Burkholderiales bacterium]|nr:carboxymuconolactone decarboxylase family protein [Burkholderiales bacterium]
MARVPCVPEAELPADLHPLYHRFAHEYGSFGNQTGVLGHSPMVFRYLYGLTAAMREEGALPPRLVEIAVVATSAVNGCKYCIGHHGPVLRNMGLPAETVDRILDPEVPGLDEVERLVRDYAKLVTERPWGIRDQVFDALRKHFTDRQIVELTVRIGLCGLFNKLNDALQVEFEGHVAPVAGQV